MHRHEEDQTQEGRERWERARYGHVLPEKESLPKRASMWVLRACQTVVVWTVIAPFVFIAAWLERDERRKEREDLKR